MKSLIKVVLTVSILTLSGLGLAFSEGGEGDKYFEASVGYMAPDQIDGGIRLGLLFGQRIDSISSINGYVNYFSSSLQSQIYEETNGGFEGNLSINQSSVNLFVFMLNFRAEFPDPIIDLFVPYAQVGAGYEFMLASYTQPGLAAQTELFLGNFAAFNIEAGCRLKLGESSYIFAQVGYNIQKLGYTDSSQNTLLVDAGGFYGQAGVGFKIR